VVKLALWERYSDMLILSQSPKGPVELTFFQPQPQELYLTDPREQRGIHCRIGMPGIMRFDSSPNAIVMLSGQRRYILSHPRFCKNLVLYPSGHPSSRHSQLNWTRIAYNDDWKKTNPKHFSANYFCRNNTNTQQTNPKRTSTDARRYC
jgi:hypothetical protein